jgi:hypothetical protein
MIASAILMTLVLPLQIAMYPGGKGQFKPFFVTSSFVDCAQILGFPKFKLRDANGNPYIPDKVLAQEPMAMIYSSSHFVVSEVAVSNRKKYIMSYVRR